MALVLVVLRVEEDVDVVLAVLELLVVAPEAGAAAEHPSIEHTPLVQL